MLIIVITTTCRTLTYCFYKVLCTYIMVNRSSPICNSSVLPRKCVSPMMRLKPCVPTCAGRWGHLDVRPPLMRAVTSLHFNLSFDPEQGGARRVGGGRPLCGVIWQATERVNKSTHFLLNVKDLSITNWSNLQTGDSSKISTDGSGQVAEVKTSRLQLWPRAFISLVIFFKNKC